MAVPKTMVIYSCKFCMDFKKCENVPEDNFLKIKHHQKDPRCFVHEKVKGLADQKLQKLIKKKKRKKKL